jgi:hypothetical protein
MRREPDRRPQVGENVGVEEDADIVLGALRQHDAVEQLTLGGVAEIEGAGAPVPDQ